MPAKPSLGIYFSDRLIEVSQVSVDGTKLERFSQMMLPAGVVQGGEVKNKLLFSQVIQQLFQSAKPEPIKLSEEVVLGISDSRVFLRVFSIPNVSGKNINDAIEYQVRSMLQVMPGEMETDWQIIGKDEEGKVEVLLAAIPKEIVTSCVSSCDLVGLRVVAVEPAIFANIRAIEQSQLQGKNLLLVYLGDEFGVFSFLTNGNPRFSEYLPLEEISRNGGVERSVATYVNFANSKYPKRPIQEIIISGSRPDLDLIVKSLGADNVNSWKAKPRIRTQSAVDLPLLLTSQGLATKLLSEESGFNVLPIDSRLEVVSQRLTTTWKAILDGLIVLTILGIVGLYYVFQNISDQHTRVGQVKSRNEQHLTEQANLDMIKKAEEINKNTNKLITLRGLIGGEEQILQELGSVTPLGITLTSLVMTRNPAAKGFADSSTWIITGKANSRLLVLSFYDELIKYPAFKTGRLFFGSLEKETGLTFRIASKQ